MMNPLMQSGAFASIGRIASMLRSGNPEQIAQALMQRNPQFRAFMETNKGKSPEQVAKEYGVDLGQVMGQFK